MAGSWGVIETSELKEDYNANTKYLEAKRNTYTRTTNSRDDIFIQNGKEYKVKIEKVQLRSAEKRIARAREAASTSPIDEVVWLPHQDHIYPRTS